MVENSEFVARAIFSPKMIYEGRILPSAFELRASIQEEYLSVLRVSIDSWKTDIMSIPQRKNRQLFGYAQMNVGEVRLNSTIPIVRYSVEECATLLMPSHAGIFIDVNGQPLIGGKPISTLPVGVPEDFLLMAIRKDLVRIAQKGLVKL